MYVSVVPEAILRTFAAREWPAGSEEGKSGSRSTVLEGELDFGGGDGAGLKPRGLGGSLDFGRGDGGGAVLSFAELAVEREGENEKRRDLEERNIEVGG